MTGEPKTKARCLVAKNRFDAPLGARTRFVPKLRFNQESFGRASEGFARAMGTGGFLIGMTFFVAIWLTWNTLAPESTQFDPRGLNFTLLTLILSMQASYAAPLILLAQNRQDDRDRVKFEQDRQRAERNLADTEYLAREVVALRLAISELATKEFVRDEMRDQLREIVEEIRKKSK
ncbi:MAG: DUF1003 domain-containing protein [Rhodoluna sp.]|nr:DUF1003 domain-containing protein [Rhodoluna sp.]MBP6186255.1 DUF1003 domain-containing protein [Rhodoluna sp.]